MKTQQVVNINAARRVVYVKLTAVAALSLFVGYFCLSSTTIQTQASNYQQPASDDFSANLNETVIREGLIAWRKLDNEGVACANCHSPDGFEIARFNISDADITRRATFHVPQQDAQKIVAMIHAIRDKYNLNNRLLDRNSVNPLQPGGTVTPGNTPAERDFNTATSTFQRTLPTLFQGRIGSLAAAQQAKNELIAFDTRKEVIGIKFPALSEDRFHGQQHGSVNDWFTEIPRVPTNSETAAQLYALHDQYLAKPNETNFWQMYNAVDTLTTNTATGTNTGVFTKAKHLALLQLSHLLREDALGVPKMGNRKPMSFRYLGTDGQGRPQYKIANPMFAVGSHSHQNRPRVEELPPIVVQNLDPATPLNRQLDKMMLPWWYMAWTFNTGLPDIANRHEYFPQSVQGHLGGDSYPMHYAYVLAKMDVVNAYVPVPQDNGQPWQPKIISLGTADDGYHFFENRNNVFHNAEHRSLLRTFGPNANRMRLYLWLEKINQDCAAGKKYGGLQYGILESFDNGLLDYVQRYDPASYAADAALVNQVGQRAYEAYNFCQPLPPRGNGNGLKTDFFNNPNLTGTPIVRVEPRIGYGFEYGARLRHPNDITPFSVRWTSQIQPLFSDEYEFKISGSNLAGGSRVWVNNQLIFDSWNGPNTLNSKINLVAGQRYNLRVEHSSAGVSLAYILTWKSSRQMQEIIPQSQLFSTVK